MKIRILLLTLLCSFSLNNTALSANKGSTPNGKPFVALKEQQNQLDEALTELQKQIDELQSKVSTLEEKVLANKSAINLLNANNESLYQQMADLISQTAENNQTIIEIYNRMNEVQTELALLQSQDNDHETRIQELNSELLELRDYLYTNIDGLQDIESQLGNNYQQIVELQNELEKVKQELAQKQVILNGECETGSTLQAIRPDGSIECALGSDNSLGLGVVTVTSQVEIPSEIQQPYQYVCGQSCSTDCTVFGGCHTYCSPNYCTGYTTAYNVSGNTTATCPLGSSLATGGYTAGDWANITEQIRVGDGWMVTATNISRTSPHLLTVRATCFTDNE